MKNILFFIIAVFIIGLAGCGLFTHEPIYLNNNDALTITGALNSTFPQNETDYDCRGTIKSWEMGKTLILAVQAKNNRNEHVSLYMYVPIKSKDNPIVGQYYIHDLSDEFSGVTYKGNFDNKNGSKLRFETGLVRIVFDYSEQNHLQGKFTLLAQQSSGERLTNGKRENLLLPDDGEIIVTGKIDVELDS